MFGRVLGGDSDNCCHHYTIYLSILGFARVLFWSPFTTVWAVTVTNVLYGFGRGLVGVLWGFGRGLVGVWLVFVMG